MLFRPHQFGYRGGEALRDFRKRIASLDGVRVAAGIGIASRHADVQRFSRDDAVRVGNIIEPCKFRNRRVIAPGDFRERIALLDGVANELVARNWRLWRGHRGFAQRVIG